MARKNTVKQPVIMAVIPTELDVAVANLETLYALALKDELFGGLAWYQVALGLCDELAREYNVSIYKVVGVTAAYSPQTPWNRNIALTRGALAAHRNGLPIGGHTQEVCRKVKDILDLPNTASRKEIGVIVFGKPRKAYKTPNFYYDILGSGAIEDGLHRLIGTATIDRWAAAGCVGGYISTLAMPSLTDASYELCAAAYAVVAERHNMETRQMQAIIWVVIRRLNGVVD